MKNTLTPKLLNNDITVGIVVGRFYEHIAQLQIDGARRVLKEAGVTRVIEVNVAGAFEIPWAAQQLIIDRDCDGIVALGCIIRGETAHFDYVAGPSADGLMRVQIDTSVPVVNGILTTENEAQALDRLGGNHGDKGAEVTQALLEMIGLKQSLAS